MGITPTPVVAEMEPADVPDGLVRTALDALAACSWSDAESRVQAMLAAVLPLHGQQLRAQIAADLECISNGCGTKSKDYADERSPGLEAEESAYWDAARRIRSGEIGRAIKDGGE